MREERELKNKPEDFKVYHHAVPQPESSFSWTSVQVLTELIGLPWNDLTMCYVLSLEPTAIRVSTGLITLDGCTGRITVMVDDDDLITDITKEVRIPCLPGMDAYDMRKQLAKMQDNITIPYDKDDIFRESY